jgi:hypothetical protein
MLKFKIDLSIGQFGRVVKASVSGADLFEVVGSNPTAVILLFQIFFFNFLEM